MDGSGLGRFFALGVNALRDTIGLFSGGMSVLEPGDRTPSPDRVQDFLDYRGIARERELKPLFQGTVSLGRYLYPRGKHGREIFLPQELLHQNCVVVGPPGAGKTEGVIIPWVAELLAAGSSVVTVDVKGDLIDRLAPAAKAAGAELWYWNTSDPRSMSWNWLHGIVDDSDVEAAARSVLGDARPNDSQPFFYERDYRWLRSLIKIVVEVYRDKVRPRELIQLVGEQGRLRDLFRKHPAIQPMAVELTDMLQFPADKHSEAVSGLLNSLHLFNSSDVVRFGELSDFRLPAIGMKPTLLVIGASLADGRKAEVLSSLMLSRLFSYIYRRFKHGQPTTVPIYFILDEAARLKERIKFEEVLSISRSARVGVCLATQDVSQFGDENAVAALLSCCSTMLTLRGCSPATAKAFAERLGQRREQVVSLSSQNNLTSFFAQTGTSKQMADVPVLGEREIMHPPCAQFCAVAHVKAVHGSKPFLIDLARA